MKTATSSLLRLFLLLSLLIYFHLPAFCQKKEASKFYTGISPVVLQKDGNEITFLNSLTSFWIAFHEYNPAFSGFRIADRKRFSRFDQSLRISHGFAESGRWDLGMELRTAHVRMDEEARSSPWKVLSKSDNFGRTDQGLTSVGLRVRAMPVGDLPELTLQGTFNYPLGKDDELRRRLGADRTQASLSATFYQNFNARTLYFLQAEWNTFFASELHDETTHFAAGSAFIVMNFMEERFFVFPGLTLAGAYQRVSSGGRIQQINSQVLWGIGGQFQAAEWVGAFLYFQRPFLLESGSLYAEWVRESYTSATLGVRILL